MSVGVGDAFVNAPGPSLPSHLWAVVSQPDDLGRVVIVNVSSDDAGLAGLDSVELGDHPWLTHRSFIRTDQAILASVTAIEAGLIPPKALREPALTAHVRWPAASVVKLQCALLRSPYTTLDIKRVLEDQGIRLPPASS